MSQDGRPGEERGEEELIAAFAALGGPLTDAEFMRLLGSDEYGPLRKLVVTASAQPGTLQRPGALTSSLSGRPGRSRAIADV